LAIPVSSTIQRRTAPCASSAGRTSRRIAASTAASLHAPSDTKFNSLLCVVRVVEGASRAAIGSTLLRPPGSSSPVQ